MSSPHPFRPPPPEESARGCQPLGSFRRAQDAQAALTLWDRKGEFSPLSQSHDCNSWTFYTRTCTVHIVQLPSKKWTWYAWFGTLKIQPHLFSTYTSAIGARDAIVRAIKRLGIRIPKQRARARG